MAKIFPVFREDASLWGYSQIALLISIAYSMISIGYFAASR